MTVHASLERLSSYLDAELAERQRLELEEHLTECASCRHRLAGLQSVAGQLRRLEQQAPPQELGFLVERQVAAERDRQTLGGRLEQSLKTFLVQPSLTPVFGLVVALALILYLFSFGVARRQQGGTRLVPVFESATPVAESRTVAGRTFDSVEGIWVERGLDPAVPVEVVDLRSGALQQPELEVFRELGTRVRLRFEGRVVEAIFSPSEAGSD
jgi:anti-sigma factor RsiW